MREWAPGRSGRVYHVDGKRGHYVDLTEEQQDEIELALSAMAALSQQRDPRDKVNLIVGFNNKRDAAEIVTKWRQSATYGVLKEMGRTDEDLAPESVIARYKEKYEHARQEINKLADIVIPDEVYLALRKNYLPLS